MKKNKMVGKKTKFDIIQFILITVSIVTMAYSIYYLISYYFENQILTSPPKNYDTNNKHLSPNEIGDSIGGILNPIIGISGSILTFLAFYIQYKTNKTQVELFDKNQIEQNKIYERELIFRLIDNLNNRIYNTKTNIDGKSYEGFAAIDSLNKLIFKELENELLYFGRTLLQHHPDIIGEKFYYDIVNHGFVAKDRHEAKELKDRLVNMHLNERWEYLKELVYYKDKEPVEIQKILRGIGGVHFYKIPFDDLKESFYSGVYYHIYSKYSNIIDGYVRSFNAILNFIEKSENRNFYYSFLQNSMSNIELCLIFYYCTSNESNDYFRKQIKDAKLLTGQLNKYKCFIDIPSNDEMEIEIENILNIVDVII
ncbi:MAG TPA: hypothetical protein DIT10_17080 [Chryseobacterium sp.]|nr:hypothetical protein [Chryseobacterium sp.]